MESIQETKHRTVDLGKRYSLPEKVTTIKYKGYILVVANNAATWIVLENDKQLQFYQLLEKFSLSDALEKFKGNITDAKKVVIQIEAKQFENTSIKRNTEERLHIYLTNACNMRCPHCYMYSGKKLENELTTTELKQLLTLYAENGGHHTTFSGGEVCTRHDLYELVQHGHECGLRIQLLTNGVLWTNETITKIAPLVSSVQISIDGFDEETNSKVRGKGCFEKALNALYKFIAAGVHTELAITPFFDETLKENYMRYAEFGKELMEKYKDTGFRVIFSGELLNGRKVKLSEMQQEIYGNIMEKINSLCYGETAIEDSFVVAMRNREIKENCTFGCLNVSAMGDVYCCSRIAYLKPIANIRSIAFSEILRLSEKAKSISMVDNLAPCRDCELKYICGGGCRVKYFDWFCKCEDLETARPSEMRSRKCDQKMKEHFYDLMIKTNHRLYM